MDGCQGERISHDRAGVQVSGRTGYPPLAVALARHKAHMQAHQAWRRAGCPPHIWAAMSLEERLMYSCQTPEGRAALVAGMVADGQVQS